MKADTNARRIAQAPGERIRSREGDRGINSEQVREAARAYLARGWYPIPIAPPVMGDTSTGKAPVIKGWQHHATTEAEISRFWPDGSRANIGLTCGPSRLVVLDFDEPGTFDAWASAHPEAAQTFTVTRDNAEPGRCHVYFTLGDKQVPPAQITKAGAGWGDLKTAGGQVVAPPSIHYTGGIYVVTNDTPPLLWRNEYSPNPLSVDGAGFDNLLPMSPTAPRSIEPGIPPTVRSMIESGAIEGERNTSAFNIGIQLRDEGHPAAVVYQHLEAFAARCHPPLPEQEIMATLRSVFSRASRPPARNPSQTGRIEAHAAPAGPPEPTPHEEWSEPEPLGELAAAPPPWPWEVYPATLRALGREITETMNTPDELAGLALLCAASIACRKVAQVAIKDDHRQFPNIYGMAAMPAATGKSPATRPITAPLIAHQVELRRAYRSSLREWQGRSKVARAQIAALEKAAAKGEEDPMATARRIAELEAIQDERPAEPILVADNATSEAMARTLSGNGGKLGVFSADGRDILAMARGRYTKDSEDVGIWLKAHAGDYLAYHRSDPNKPPFECPEPILSAFIAVQPDAMKSLGGTSALRESGFLARWLYVIPDMPSMTDYPEASVPDYVRRKYGFTIAGLLAMAPDEGENGEPKPWLCRMDNDARAEWKAAHDILKRDALAAPPLLAQCLGKLPEHLARIALIFSLVEAAEQGEPPPLGMAAPMIERAATLGSVLLAHIRRAVSMLGETSERAAARELWPILAANRERLSNLRHSEGLGRIEAVKPRDLARYHWAGCEDSEQARRMLAALEVKGWLRMRTAPGKGDTARSHELYELHPGGV